ncbi:MAG: hypothetical protein JSS81_03865 [Acidobacteria bacterium]|nr:hypothetical protein [Acidobacteriota bacterium]
MNKNPIYLIVWLLCLAGGLGAQNLPKPRVELGRARVAPNRELVLSMVDPEKHPRDADDELYTCPDQTRGHYYSGVATVSLIDVRTKKTINEIEITGDGFSDGNVIDLPYLIKKGYYNVPRVDKNGEGKPVLIKLQDYNGDGRAQEFALFDAVACMGLETTLIGYSARQDKVVQYQTELATSDGTSKEYWVDYLFGQRPVKPGVWKYQIDYRGRGGALEKYEIRYDRKKEMFYGTRKSIFEEDKEEDKTERKPPNK